MKDRERNLIVQLLFESNTGAYLEWIIKEVKWLLIKFDFKDEPLVMLFVKQNKPASHISYHIIESQEIYFLVG
jgi:hypothetical protein